MKIGSVVKNAFATKPGWATSSSERMSYYSYFAGQNMIYTLVLVVNLVFGIVLSAGLVAAKGFIMKMLNVSDEMMPDAMIYMSIVGGGLFLQAVYNVMLQILRCNGHTKVGMYISVVINLINIVGNFTFLYGPLKFKVSNNVYKVNHN